MTPPPIHNYHVTAKRDVDDVWFVRLHHPGGSYRTIATCEDKQEATTIAACVATVIAVCGDDSDFFDESVAQAIEGLANWG